MLDTAVKSGCKLSPYLACYLIDRRGDSLSVLLTEMEKPVSLCRRRRNHQRKRGHADRKTVESSAFDLAKAILKREYERSFHILSRALYQRLEPLAIMGALNMSFLTYTKPQLPKAGQIPVSTSDTRFNYKDGIFRIKNAFRDVSTVSVGQLRHCHPFGSGLEIKIFPHG